LRLLSSPLPLAQCTRLEMGECLRVDARYVEDNLFYWSGDKDCQTIRKFMQRTLLDNPLKFCNKDKTFAKIILLNPNTIIQVKQMVYTY